jgi:hypothetical protein
VDLSRWNPFKPFVRTRQEVASYLERAVNETIDCRHWDDFLRIPIRGAPEMEAIRAKCESLASHETIREDGGISFNPEARRELQRLLDIVKNDG